MLADLLTAYRAGESWLTLALLNDPNDAAYTQSGINAVTVAVYDESSSTPTTNLWISTQPTPAAVFFNTLQTGFGWDLPDGFNFKHIVTPLDLNAAINAGHTFTVRYTVDTVLFGTRVFKNRVVVLA